MDLMELLQHPVTALVVCLVLAGVALTGKLSNHAATLIFILAWIIGSYALMRAGLRDPRLVIVGICLLGCAVCLVSFWSMPLHKDIVVASVPIAPIASPALNSAVVEAQVQEIKKLDEFIAQKGEVELLETFDVLNILEFNIRKLRQVHRPKSVTKKQVVEMERFFKGGESLGMPAYLKKAMGNGTVKVTKLPHDFYIELSPKYVESSRQLDRFMASSELPQEIKDQLGWFRQTLLDDMTLINQSLNECVYLDPKSIFDSEEIEGPIFKKFVPLNTQADKLGQAIRAYLKIR